MQPTKEVVMNAIGQFVHEMGVNGLGLPACLSQYLSEQTGLTKLKADAIALLAEKNYTSFLTGVRTTMEVSGKPRG